MSPICHNSSDRTPDAERERTEQARAPQAAADPTKNALAIVKRKQTAARRRLWALANGISSNGTVSRSGDALRRLGITRQEVAEAPQISVLLKRTPGGLKQVIAAMRLVQGDEIIRKFLKQYDSIPVGDRERLPIEAIALAACVKPTHLLGAAMLAMQKQGVTLSKILAVTNHPKITAARVKFGLTPSGERDRTALDTIVGLLPSPRAASSIGQVVFSSGNQVLGQQRKVSARLDDDDTEFNEENPDLDQIFPPARIMQEKLACICALTAERPRSEGSADARRAEVGRRP
jgi:hypothetical protein